MSPYIRNLILTVILILCQLNMFAAIIPPRRSRKRTMLLGNATAVLLLVVYAVVGRIFDVYTAANLMLFIFTIPSILAGFAMSRVKDGRFWFVFFFCDAVGAAISEIGFVLGMMLCGGADLGVLLLRGIPTILITVFVLLVLRPPFESMLETRDMHWGALAVVEFILEAMIYFMASYPGPLEHRPQDYPSVLLTLIVLLVVLASNILILGSMKRASDDRMRLAMAQKQYENMMHNQQQVRHTRHDLQHHLKLLEGLAAGGDLDGVKTYLSDLVGQVDGARVSDLCKSHVCNLVLNWYENEANDRGIAFSCQANIPEEPPAVSADLCSVLSNAMQNAIDACTGQTAPWIRVMAKPAGPTLLLTVENSCPNPPKLVNGLPQTTKQGDGHGLGLSSIRAVTQKYAGYFKIEAEPGVFRLSAAMDCGWRQEPGEAADAGTAHK